MRYFFSPLFLAAAFLAATFLAGAFLAGAFASAFLASAFFAGAFLADAFFAGLIAGAGFLLASATASAMAVLPPTIWKVWFLLAGVARAATTAAATSAREILSTSTPSCARLI